MKFILVTFLICSLGFMNKASAYAQAAVNIQAKIAEAIAAQGASANTTVAVSLSTTCGWLCIAQIMGTAWQAVEFFLSRDNGTAICQQASQGGAGCVPTMPPYPPPGPGFNPPPFPQVGPPTGTATGMTGLGSVPIPRPGVTGMTTGTTAGVRPPLSPNQRIPGILANRPDLKNILNALKDKGYTMDFDKGVINGPNGPINPATLGNPAVIASLGGTAASMKLAEDISKKVVDQMKKDLEKQIGALEAGGAGAGNLGGGGGPEDDDLKNYMKRMMARMPAQEKNNINGLSTLVNGEPIGIAAGNIFKTIEMRYDKLQESGIFIAPVK